MLVALTKPSTKTHLLPAGDPDIHIKGKTSRLLSTSKQQFIKAADFGSLSIIFWSINSFGLSAFDIRHSIEKWSLVLQSEACKMALGEGLDNDTRGWIMTVLSGIGKL